MTAVRRFCLSSSLVVLGAIGCDQSQPLDPSEPLFGAAEAPSSTSAVAGSESRIDVSWQDNSTNKTGFEVHRSTTGPSGLFGLRAYVDAGFTGYGDTELIPSTQYCYKVRAFRTTGSRTRYSEFSTIACATTLTPPLPSAPSGTDAKPANSTTVDVRWIDNSSNEDGFRVERSLDFGATWASAQTVALNVTSFTDAGRASEQPVCYRVVAFNGRGDSPASNADCTSPPAAPGGLTATAVDGPAIDLTWTDNSAVEDGYEVQRATDGVTFSTVASLPANSVGHRDVGVNSTLSYAYRVQARKDDGFSDLSNTATVAGSCVATTVEQCANGLDDDCNGLIDTEDDACQCFAHACPQGFVCEGWSGYCLPDYCGDGVQNGDESDVDCGGSCVNDCAAGQHCSGNADCASGSCVDGICQPGPGGQP